MVIVDGLAVDATGLPRKEAFQEFSSLTRASAEYPEFLLARPMFTRELERPVTDFDGYFNVLERNALGEDIQGVDWFKVYKAAEDSINISSENMDSIKGVALLAAVMRDYEKADNYFRKYVAERPDELVYRAAWAHVLLFRKKFPEARRVAQSVVSRDPDSVAAQFTLACAQYALDRSLVDRQYWSFADAGAKYQVAVWLRVDGRTLRELLGPDSLNDLSSLLIGRQSGGNYALIMDSLRRGESAFLQDDFKTALLYYDAAKRYGVESVPMFQNMALCNFKLGNAEHALDILEKLAKVMGNNGDEAWYRYGFILLQQELYDEAILAFEQATSIRPRTLQYHFALACAYAGARNFDEAWPILSRLSRANKEQLEQWLRGDKPYLQAIRSDPRFDSLL